jgi:hypothetical protein
VTDRAAIDHLDRTGDPKFGTCKIAASFCRTAASRKVGAVFQFASAIAVITAPTRAETTTVINVMFDRRLNGITGPIAFMVVAEPAAMD